MGILLKAEDMVGARQSGFQVAEHGIDGLERRMFGARGPAASGMGFVQDASTAHGSEAAEAVGNKRSRRRQRLLGEGLDGFLGKRPLGQADENRLPRFGSLDGSDELDLVGRAATRRAALALAAQVGVVDLDATRELPPLLAQAHDFHQFVLEQPSGRIRNSQVPHEFQRRYAVLGLGHQMHRQEPFGQRHLAGLKDRAADQAALIATVAALEIQPRAAPKLAVPALAATRTDESFRPAPSSHEFLTLLLRAVTVEKLQHRQPRLVLDLVQPHRAPPVAVRSCSQATGSWREPVTYEG